MWQALAAEGPAGLYRGFAAVLTGVLPANALYYGTYELLKGHLPGPVGAAAVGAAAQVRSESLGSHILMYYSVIAVWPALLWRTLPHSFSVFVSSQMFMSWGCLPDLDSASTVGAAAPVSFVLAG